MLSKKFLAAVKFLGQLLRNNFDFNPIPKSTVSYWVLEILAPYHVLNSTRVVKLVIWLSFGKDSFNTFSFRKKNLSAPLLKRGMLNVFWKADMYFI